MQTFDFCWPTKQFIGLTKERFIAERCEALGVTPGETFCVIASLRQLQTSILGSKDKDFVTVDVCPRIACALLAEFCATQEFKPERLNVDYLRLEQDSAYFFSRGFPVVLNGVEITFGAYILFALTIMPADFKARLMFSNTVSIKVPK